VQILPDPNETDIQQPDADPIAASTPPPAPRSLASTIFIGSDGLRAGWALLLFLVMWFGMATVATIAVQAVISHFERTHHAAHTESGGVPPGITLFNESMLGVFAMLSTAIMAKIERRPALGYGLAPAKWLPRLLAGFAWGIAFLSLLVFVLKAAGLLGFDGRVLFGANALRYGALWFAAFCAVGFFEEVFFRGYMQFTLARGLAGIYGWLGAPNRQAAGFWTAAFLISFGFGLTHSSNPGESPIGLLSAGLIGVVFCLSLWRTGSLWWAIGLHASWDWAQSYFYGVADSGALVAGHLFATHPVGRVILSGGQTGPEGSVLILPIVLMIAIVILVTLPQTHSGYSLRDASDNPAALDLA
jgi:membrane protease YdiL (CAAX protease family)